MSHRVAVIVRTKERPAFLARALADVAAQTYGDAEVIVVSDGGAFAAVEEVIAASSISDRVTALETTAPGGRCAAANTGLRATDAEFVVLHDDDDRWHADFLSRTVAYLSANPEDAGVMVPTEIVYERSEGDGWVESGSAPFWAGLESVSFTSLLEVNRAVPISFLYRRAVHDEVGFYDESLETVEDWEFYLRLAAQHSIGFLPGQVLAYWTQRPSAGGVEGNSIFELAGAHERDDLAVRNRELQQWVLANGAGLPLYIALVEKRIREDLTRELASQLERQKHEIVDEVYARHPVWRRLGRLRAIGRRPNGPRATGRS